jgi:hypothetical protein
MQSFTVPVTITVAITTAKAGEATFAFSIPQAAICFSNKTTAIEVSIPVVFATPAKWSRQRRAQDAELALLKARTTSITQSR